MQRLLLVTLVMLLTACATVQQQSAKYETGAFPDVGQRTTASVGQVMVSRYDYLSNITALLKADVPGSFWAGRTGLVTGARLLAAMSSGQQVFCLGGGIGSPCLRDSNGDGMFDYAAAFNAYGVLVNGRNITPAPFKIESQNILDGFKFELIYQGLDKGVIRVAYREYTDNLARPAFSQDLTYTLETAGDTVARFRDVSMSVHSADNNEIVYTVNSGFSAESR